MKRILHISLLLALFTGYFTVSCKHEPNNTKAIVKVVDRSNIVQPNVKVTFDIDTAGGKKIVPGLPAVLYTDVNGTVEKSFDNGVVIDLKAEKDTFEARGFILLEPGSTKEVTLTLKPKI